MKVRRFVAIFFGFLLVLVLGFWGLTATLTMSNPVVLGQYLVTPTSELGGLFAYRELDASQQPRPIPANVQPLPRSVTWEGESAPVEDFLTETKTNSFLVMCRGENTHEWFKTEADRERRQSSWSVAKSFISLLVGQLIDEGKITEDTTLVEMLPEYKTGTEFDEVTVGHLLDMSSGIDLNEDYSYFKPFWGVGGLQITTDIPAYLKKNQGMRFAPGEKFDYRSVDTQYLSMIVAAVEGDNLTNIMQRRIWEPLGMEDDAHWNLDREGGIEKGFSAINATPRDFAKMGLLIANNGKVGDKQIVSEAWIKRITTVSVEDDKGWGYAAKWWHPPGFEQHHDVTAMGVYGQYVYVNREQGTVVVKLSDYESERDEGATIEVFRQFAQECEESAS